ncbi:3-keto-5-aminohexanoate cleavage protein [Nocardia pseudovaccinii]|uniref:3-keto-5-aminohexanoate cleavage protein n=1 Tax=Nocardia pseudovaccinii TaxID=189540 RepID=UPI0007C6DAE0|nr:3-keto-5-aminohexanoate cleavage protein [Nocardia pseudovaccinii]
MEKLIIQVRVNEGTMREVSPNVPYSPAEIADQSIECWRQGASIVHYHARDPETGAKSADTELYADTVRRIKKECDLITFPTLGAAMLPTPAERLAHIVEMAKDPATKPDCIPVDMLTTNLGSYDANSKQFTGSGDQIYLNTPNILRQLCEESRAVGVKPVSMMWNVAGVRLTEAFVEMGLYDEPLLCELSLFGDHFRGYGHPGTIKGLYASLDFFPPGANWIWMANLVGGNAFPVLAAAIALGGHVAIGVADHAYPELGNPTNAQLVGYVVEMARYMGREVATATEAREILGLT